MSGDMNIGREIDGFISDAEAKGRAEGIKKSNIGTEIKRALFGDKMHDFTWKKVTAGKDLTAVFRELFETNPETVEGKTIVVGRDARRQVSRVFKFLKPDEISSLVPLIRDGTIKQKDMERAIYYTDDEVLKKSLAQLFLIHSNPEKWKLKINNLVKKINAVNAEAKSLLEPNAEHIVKTLEKQLAGKIKPEVLRMLTPFVTNLLMSAPEASDEVIDTFAQTNRVEGLKDAVRAAFHEEFKARSKLLLDDEVNHQIQNFEHHAKPLQRLVADGKYAAAALLLKELALVQAGAKRGTAISAFEEKEGIKYPDVIALLAAASGCSVDEMNKKFDDMNHAL